MLKVRIRVNNIIGESSRAVRSIAYSDNTILKSVRKSIISDTDIITFYVKRESYDSVLKRIIRSLYGDRLDVISKRKSIRVRECTN